MPGASPASSDPHARHRLAPLLAPASIAIVGASPKRHSPGNDMLRALKAGGFTGRIFPVNPNHREIEGLACWPTIAELPERVDLAVLAIANARVEQQLRLAIDQGARAAAILASLYVEGDRQPPLTSRIAAMVREAGIPLLGGNAMGFYNLDRATQICGYPPPTPLAAGGITYITHSGSAFGALAHYDRRFRFNLVVSSGQELAVSAADYLDYALDQPTTRVAGLLLETVRDPEAFVAALEKARVRDVPVLILKVGRTPESAKLAVSHSGAIAGDDAAYQAVFDRSGALRVDTLDDLANAMLLFSGPRRAGPGGLATVHDSGGERELLVDLAAVEGVPIAPISEKTRERLTARLDYGLDPTNPCDAWGTGHDFEGIFGDCLLALVEDEKVALGGIFTETQSGDHLSEGYMRALMHAFERTSKPVVLASNLGGVGGDPLGQRLTEAGVPSLSGTDSALRAIRALFAYRDFRAWWPGETPPSAPAGLRDRWRARLSEPRLLDEWEGLALLADYGLPVPLYRRVATEAEAIAAAEAIGFPVALKTAVPGIAHKSDVGGVHLALGNRAAVVEAYADLARRLGAEALAMAMAPKGVELAFGAVSDPQFGPIVLVGAGGLLIEILRDRRTAMPPFGGDRALQLLDGLTMRALLDGVRGRLPADRAAIARALALFSAMVADLGDLIGEIDCNPVIAHPSGVLIVDALIVPKAVAAGSR